MPTSGNPYIELEHAEEAPPYIPSTISTGPLPSCSIDPETQIVSGAKYLTGVDHCRRQRYLRNDSDALMFSDGGQAVFRDGSDVNPILLGGLRSNAGLNSVIGLHNNKLTRIVPSGVDDLVLQYSGGALSFQKLLQSVCYDDATVLDLTTKGYVNLLYDDEAGSLCVRKLRATGTGDQPRVLTQNTTDHSTNPFEFSWSKLHDFDHDATSSPLYYWDKGTEMIAKLEPPTLVGLEAYSDYRLSMNDVTGAPEWTKVASETTHANASWSMTPMTATVVGGNAITLSKEFDGGGGSPRFEAVIQPKIDGQVTAIATGQVGGQTGYAFGGLRWLKNGSPTTGGLGRVAAYAGDSGPQSIALFCDILTVTDVLTLELFHDSGSQFMQLVTAGLVSVTHDAVNP